MKRVLTALIGVPLAVLIILYFPIPLLTLVVTGFSVLCFDELLRLAGSSGNRAAPGRWVLLLGALVTASFMWGPTAALGAIAASLLFALTAIAMDGPAESTLPKMGVVALGILYCSAPFGFIVLLQRDQFLLLLVIIWIGDTAAYYGGRALGRHALAPVISPKKTVEGAVAGLLGSVAAGVIFGVWRLGADPARLAAVSLLAAAVGQIGDLAESAIKRSVGVKDSSSILPGHGGMLDRFDSVLFAAPVFYWLFRI
jgi:phosphatidate cytidylyltransferase